MSEFALPKAGGRELLDLVAVQYYTLEDLVDDYFEGDDKSRYLELLRTVDQLVLADVKVLAWDSQTREVFIALCCLLGEKLLDEPSSGRVAISARLPRRLADVAVLAAAEGEGTRERVKNMACEFWVRSRFDEFTDEETFVRSSAGALLPIDPRDTEVDRVVRRAVRLAIARKRPDPAVMPIAATPASVAAAHSAATAASPDVLITPVTLSVWNIPASRPREQVLAEVSEVLQQLQRDRSMMRCLSPRTQNQLGSMLRNRDEVNGSPFYWAASELWNRFVENGNGTAGDCARKLARLRYELAATESPRNQASAYMALLCTQLPELLTRATPKYLISEAIERGKALDLRVPALTLNAAVIEAYAGRCRQLYASNDRAALQQLLDAAPDLAELWTTIKNNTTGQAESVRGAWQYIITLADVKPADSPSQLDGIFREKVFCDAIRTGVHGDVLAFITKHSDEVQERLRNRLDYRVSPQNLMMPDGLVYNPRTADRNQQHTLFILGRDRLKNEEHARAADVFNNLAQQTDGRNRIIAKSYEAYALARDNNLLRARPILSSLAESGNPRAATFWNLACCYGPNESRQQLQALASGIDAAPHPWILNAAVYLALTLEDHQRLLQWLPFLTFAEALVLRYQFRFDSMVDVERDDALLRIDDYIKDGEPQIPDPCTEDLSPSVCDSVLTTLLNRHMPEAMEFWLRCREPIGYRWFTYWQLRADFYEKTGRRPVAAASFERELHYRLAFLARPQSPTNPNTLRTTRQRIEQWLSFCRTPQLTEQGRNFYTRIREFEERTKIRLLSNDRLLHDYYAPRRQQEDPPPPREITSVISRAATVCSRQFHTVENLSIVRPMLGELVEALTVRGAARTASALTSAMDIWRRYDETRDGDDGSAREKVLSSAQQVLSTFDAALISELSRAERDAAEPLLRVFRRVTDRFARDLKLLPKLAAEPCGAVGYVAESGTCVFAIRILSNSETVPVRLVAVTVAKDGGDDTFIVRDDLRSLPVLVTAQSPAVLTVDATGRLEPSRSYQLQVSASYEYSGATYGPDVTTITLNVENRTPPAVKSPFVYGTMVGIDVDNIPRQFVGREREKEEIFEAIANRRPLYLDGIRRVGKSSLLNSIAYELRRRDDLVPCRVLASSANTFEDHGGVLFDIFRQIAAGLQEAIGVTLALPAREACREDTPAAFAEFVGEVRNAIGNRSVLVLLDEFQVLTETANAFTRTNPRAAGGVIGILNMIAAEQARSDGKLLWIFAGHLPLRQHIALLPGPLLWAVLRALQVNFLDRADVAALMRKTLTNGIEVPDETVQRLYAHTKGHPEVVQQMAEAMLLGAVRDGRQILTPFDADRAALDVAAQSDDSFRDTWYPIAKLSPAAKTICADFVKAVGIGQRIQQHLLAAGGKVTPEFTKAIDDLKGRQVIDVYPDGNIAIKAYVLDLWLRKHVADSGGLNGSVATFIDVANLTRGTGANSVLLDCAGTDSGVAGKYQLATVFEAIEGYGRKLSAAPMAATWAINYPPGSPAVLECNLRNYDVKNIPEALMGKGSDDASLMQKINDVYSDYPLVDHFVIVTGDIDYSVTLNELLAKGKHVHVLSRRSGLSKKYAYLQHMHPNHFSLVELEQLLDHRL